MASFDAADEACFPFFELPRELRDKIYDLCHIHHDKTCVDSIKRGSYLWIVAEISYHTPVNTFFLVSRETAHDYEQRAERTCEAEGEFTFVSKAIRKYSLNLWCITRLEITIVDVGRETKAWTPHAAKDHGIVLGNALGRHGPLLEILDLSFSGDLIPSDILYAAFYQGLERSVCEAKMKVYGGTPNAEGKGGYWTWGRMQWVPGLDLYDRSWALLDPLYG
ncbi:hypothetical protein LTR95_000641 [Oleoguttula sp. CCFEE 5521]